MRLCNEKSRVDGKSCVACPVMEHDLLTAVDLFVDHA